MTTASDALTALGQRLHRLSALLRRSCADRRGSLTTMFAFSAIPLIGFVGLATDYGLELAAKSKLDHAADAAVVAAITSAQTYIVNYTGSADPTADALKVGQAQGLAQFNANTGSLPATVPAPAITMSASGRTLSATTTYSFSMPTIFMKALGTKVMNFSGTASSTLTIPAFTNIHIVIDTSSSMGIGATLKDQQLVYNATSGCAVACHYSGTTTSARNAGATLRIDVAKNAVVTALNQIANATNSNRFQVAIYTMSSQFNTLFPLSTSISDAITAVKGLDISNTSKDGGTNTTNSLKTLGKNLNTDGDGLTQATAQGFVMLITDGVQDSDIKVPSGSGYVDGTDSNFSTYSPCSTPNCKTFTDFAVPITVESFDPSACSTIKTKGYTLMTLNTTYLVPPSNLQNSSPSGVALKNVFTFIQNYLLSSISSNLASCASGTSNAYSANSPTEINAAVQQMFAAAGAQARITN